MTEHQFLQELICKLAASNANFSQEVLDKLDIELEHANEEGLLDEDYDYAPEAIMFCGLGFPPIPED